MKPFLIITQIIYSLSLLPWYVIWMMSFMSFDSGIGFGNSAFVLVITLYPVAIIICSLIAWKLRGGNTRLAVIINLVPLLWVAAFCGFMIFV
ncbi:hypothetical protein [Bacillus marasmi]|uniref:hypothetical protein n=1 Tax=Bacillus marasmi TaxID=1926279 RepID=UPI0011C7BB49|nr:hypothetical protein [Bacillus marasmi]